MKGEKNPLIELPTESPEKYKNYERKTYKPNIEEPASCLSKLVFWWVGDLIKLGEEKAE